MSQLAQRFTYRNKKILAHAKGQACKNCGAQDETVVAAHSNQAKHGKGRGIKAHDAFVAFLCHRCHSWLDSGKGRDPTNLWDEHEKSLMFNEAMHKTWLILLKDEIIK